MSLPLLHDHGLSGQVQPPQTDFFDPQKLFYPVQFSNQSTSSPQTCKTARVSSTSVTPSPFSSSTTSTSPQSRSRK
jgi:hypothetical protein